MFKLIINSIGVFSTPNDFTLEVSNIQEARHQVTYSSQNYVYHSLVPTTFTLIGGAYTYLYNIWFVNGFCNSMDVELQKACGDDYQTIFEGKIYVTDCVFDLSKCSVTINLISNNWQSKIESNLERIVPLDATTTLSSTTDTKINLTPIQTFNLGTFYLIDKSDGSSVNVSNRQAWRIHDVFRLMVEYVTDNEMGFYSQYLSNLPTTNDIAVTSGQILRTGSGYVPELSIKKTFNALRKLLNLYMFFDKTELGLPRLRIENDNFFRAQGSSVSLNDVKDLHILFDQSQLYSVIKVGNTLGVQTNSEIDANFFYPKIEGGSYVEEVFNVKSGCNINAVLDLTVGDFAYDHNILENVMVDQNMEFDETPFFIQYEDLFGNFPFYSDLLNLVTSIGQPLLFGFYNQMFINKEIVARHNIHGDLIKHHTSVSDTFTAINNLNSPSNFNADSFGWSGSQVVISPVRFANDYASVNYGNYSKLGNDTNNNYGNGQTQGTFLSQSDCKYIVPADGIYRFEAESSFNLIPVSSNVNVFKYKLIVKNSGGTTVIEKINTFLFQNLVQNGNPYMYSYEGNGGVVSFNYQPGTNYNVTVDFRLYLKETVYCEDTDRVYIEFTFDELDLNYGTIFPFGSGADVIHIADYFQCIYARNGGDIVLQTKSNSLKLSKAKFNTLLTEPEIHYILNAPHKRINFNYNDINYISSISNININHLTNEADFEVILY